MYPINCVLVHFPMISVKAQPFGLDMSQFSSSECSSFVVGTLEMALDRELSSSIGFTAAQNTVCLSLFPIFSTCNQT